MDTSTAVLALRVALSLACVLGLLWWLARRTGGRPGARAGARRARAVPVAVVGRQSLGGRASVAVVEVAGRHLLLGVSERGVCLLTEVTVPAEPTTDELREQLDPAELERLLDDAPESSLPLSTPAARTPAVPTQRNPLEGSILDAGTWRRAVVAVQERTLRR
ncbi:MAG: flagellar biosynthetic protein FliO [Actinomycetales bacterium]|nr:flagellar biosynthetic protein FliO [Actinomycetales bacterium]